MVGKRRPPKVRLCFAKREEGCRLFCTPVSWGPLQGVGRRDSDSEGEKRNARERRKEIIKKKKKKALRLSKGEGE